MAEQTVREESDRAIEHTAPTEPSFADLGVESSIVSVLERAGVHAPFPVQALTLPITLRGGDLIGQARTGTGKTLAFSLPIVQTATEEPVVQALVLVPTRELCIQVTGDLALAASGRPLRVLAVYGGRPIAAQITALRNGAQIVVGTPGRILDHLRQGTLDLSHLRVAVLDEADQMLDLGFLPDVEAILKATPVTRQSMLFSATMPKEVMALSRRYLRQPTFVHAEAGVGPLVPETTQHFFQVHYMDRFEVLCRLLDMPGRERVAVFRRTKRGVDRTIQSLTERGYRAGAFHGDLPQHVREKVLTSFRKGTIDVLVATDVAARGLDIDGVSHVINYDTPTDERAFTHRTGRTGRAGAAGVAITFVTWNELATARSILAALGMSDEIEEVFSTSPLLIERFGLPTKAVATAARRAASVAPPAPPVLVSPVEPAPGSAVRTRRRRGTKGHGDTAATKGSAETRRAQDVTPPAPLVEGASGATVPGVEHEANMSPDRPAVRRRRSTRRRSGQAPGSGSSGQGPAGSLA